MIEAERAALRRRYGFGGTWYWNRYPGAQCDTSAMMGGNVIANVPHNLTDSAKTVAAVVSHMAAHGFDLAEVTRQAEDAWMELLIPNPVMTSFLADCTPGYYNKEGQFDGRQFPLGGGYNRGAPAYFRCIRQWRESGDFAGLEFSRK
jgi:hypothetical protein